MNAENWEALRARARMIVECTIAELPDEVRVEAQKVPCLFQRENEDDPDILGLYGQFEPGEVSPANGPIILYLVTINEYCHDEDADFDQEVRMTYLHELGHHLGWDEGDLEERGL